MMTGCGLRPRIASKITLRRSRSVTVGSVRARGGSEIELDALREGQRVGVVDRVRLPAHVRLPCIRPRRAAAAGFLLAAERAADLGTGRADVDVRDAAVGARRRKILLGRLEILREDRRRKT